MREKINRLARKMGYRPHPVLAAFASHQFKKAPSGVPLAFIAQGGLYQKSEEGAYQREREFAAELGYDLQLYTVPELRALPDPSRMLYHRGIEGIILSDFFEDQSLPAMDWSLFALVALGGQGASNSKSMMLHRATADHFLLVRNAWLKALDAGYRRIGLFLLEHQSPISDDVQRHSAGLFCLSRTPRRDRVPILCLTIGDAHPYHKPVAKWMNRYRPEVVIGFSDFLLWSLEAAGWKFPDSMAFIALIKDPEGHGVAGFVHNRDSIFRATIELIDFQVRHRLRGIPQEPRVMMIGAEWCPGESLPDRNANRSAPNSLEGRDGTPCLLRTKRRA